MARSHGKNQKHHSRIFQKQKGTAPKDDTSETLLSQQFVFWNYQFAQGGTLSLQHIGLGC